MPKPTLGQAADRAAFEDWLWEAKRRWRPSLPVPQFEQDRFWECWQAAQEYGLGERGCCQEEAQDDPG